VVDGIAGRGVVGPGGSAQVLEHLLAAAYGGLGGEHVEPGGLQGHERAGHVVDLPAYDVLELGLERRPRHAGDDRARLPLVRHVERVGDVDVVLRGSAGPLVVERAVGDELRVHVDERIGAQARSEHVGIGLGEFVAQRADVEIGRHHAFDGRVEREAVGLSLVGEHGGIEQRAGHGGGPGQRRRGGKRFGELQAAGRRGR
jgi:hypothetical protein